VAAQDAAVPVHQGYGAGDIPLDVLVAVIGIEENQVEETFSQDFHHHVGGPAEWDHDIVEPRAADAFPEEEEHIFTASNVRKLGAGVPLPPVDAKKMSAEFPDDLGENNRGVAAPTSDFQKAAARPGCGQRQTAQHRFLLGTSELTFLYVHAKPRPLNIEIGKA
jgi:hypothetical protein